MQITKSKFALAARGVQLDNGVTSPCMIISLNTLHLYVARIYLPFFEKCRLCSLTKSISIYWSYSELFYNKEITRDHMCVHEWANLTRMVGSNTHLQLTQWSFSVKVIIWQMATLTQNNIMSNASV
jgi:hypothetical protein